MITKTITMKNNFIILVITLLFIIGCKKEENVVPISSFSFRGDTCTILKIATYDTCTLINSSKNADSYLWDLGDGRTSTENQVVLSYTISGIYIVKLVTKNSDGETETSKKVIVLDRVLKKIMFDYVQWDTINTNGWPTSSKADIYFQIQKFTDATVIQYSIYPNCPIIYKSPVVKNVSCLTQIPFTISIPEKVVIDKKLIQFAYLDNLNNAYLISLMAVDKNGNVYCLQNNYGGGTYFGILKENFNENEFVVQIGPFSAFQLICDFE